MSERTRKTGDAPTTTAPPSRPGLQANISPDDPSIPVLTERLTLPPLDLDLDFKLPPLRVPPPQPAVVEPAALTPTTAAPDDLAAEAAPLPTEPVLPAEEPAARATEPPAAPLPSISAAADSGPATAIPVTPAPPEFTIPASLLRASGAVPPVSVPPLPSTSSVLGLDAIADEPAAPALDEVELREAILIELANSLPQDVESIVRQQMEIAIERAIKRFAADVRMAIAASIREILDRAVKAELERRKK